MASYPAGYLTLSITGYLAGYPACHIQYLPYSAGYWIIWPNIWCDLSIQYLKGSFAGAELIEDAAQGPHVRLGVVGLTLTQL